MQRCTGESGLDGIGTCSLAIQLLVYDTYRTFGMFCVSVSNAISNF